MKEQIISFETAKLAKEKGFKYELKNCIYEDEGLFQFYKNINGKVMALGNTFAHAHPNAGSNEIPMGIDAPTQSLLQKWLRDVHGLIVNVNSVFKDDNKGIAMFWYWIQSINKYNTHEADICFNTYEDALEAGLKEAFNLIP